VTSAPTEVYVVKFWIKNELGFRSQKSEEVSLHSKGKHAFAEKMVKDKYRKEPFCQDIQVISVIYQ
jgi:hypothetical protein